MFDSPGQNPRTPKDFEHSRRDAEHSVSPDHDHFHFTDTAAVPQKWRDLFSPDTDVYHIGLPLLNSYVHDVYVQLSPMTSPELRLLHLNQVQLDLAGDPDLALVPPGLRACVVQTLFICSGCDYLSFFAGFGKATIMRHFFENAWFITGTQDIPGTLADTAPNRVEDGFMSFVTLVGTMYFKKHLAQFTVNTPRALYMSHRVM